MKKLILIVLLISPFLVANAQGVAAKGNIKISGIVKDSLTNLAVEFANIALIDPSTKKPINGAVADDKGKFAITNVAPGNYSVEISFIGFETKRIPSLKVTDKNIEIGTFKISPSVETLKEVVVEGQRQLVEEKVDRTVYNAENDGTTKGGDATDVLKRVPMLSVDLDGNVSMRGNSNIRVLINNKPSTIAASSISDALKQIPADQIKSVEVITSPSAKYDAEGSAGIINIITKKNTLQGANLNVDMGSGIRGSNLGLNGSYRKGKMGFSLGGFGRAGYNVTGSFKNNQAVPGTEKLNTQEADTRRNDLMGRYQLGWDYDINKNNSLAASVRYGVRNGNNYQDGLLTQAYSGLTLLTTNVRDVKNSDASGTVDVNLDYTHTFNKPQRELSASALFSRNNRANNIFNTSYLPDESIDFRLKNDNKSFNQESTLQVDYQTPISTNQLLEVGAKNIIRTVSSDYQYLRATGSDGAYVSYQPGNVFNYNQNVTASYLSYTYNMRGGYSLKAGSRYEYTTINANFQNSSETVSKIPSYGVMVPSVNLSKKLKNGNTLKAAYNRRIQRPSIQFLNPNVQTPNSLSRIVGNPNLSPEFTNNYEVTYSTFVKGTSLNFSGFVRNTTGAIQSLRDTLPGNVIQTRYANIGVENAYGSSIFANVNIGQKFSLNGGSDVYYAVLNNNVPDPKYNAHNEGWVISGRLFGSYNLSKGWGLQFFSFYRGRQVQLQGFQGGFGVYSLGLKKDFKNKKGSFGFGAENFATPAIHIHNQVQSPLIDQRSVNVMHNMNFRANVSFRFGKMSFDNAGRKKKKSVNNDDLKEGGDGGGGGADMSGQQQQNQRAGGFTPGQAPVTNAKKSDVQIKTDPTAIVKADGTWTYTIESPQGGGGTLLIKKDGEVLSGTIVNSRSNRETALKTIELKGNELNFSYENNFGGNISTTTFKGVIVDNTLNGTMSIGQFGSFPMNAKRAQ